MSMNKTATKVKRFGIILGALVTCLLILLDKGKLPVIRGVHNMQDTGGSVKKESVQ